MRVHRFYVASDIKLKHDFWIHDAALIHQWRKVLRFQPGQELVLFDGLTHDRLYRIEEINEREAHLTHVTDFERRVPKQDVYLLWTLLKKDKNDWVLQKCTELGVSHFLPLITDRSEKLGFNRERAEKIIIEAVEQSGRSDIPTVREPMHVSTALDELSGKVTLYVAEQDGQDGLEGRGPRGVLIGPEGGWSDAEKVLFKTAGLPHLNIHDFTLRAETAAITAASKLVQ